MTNYVVSPGVTSTVRLTSGETMSVLAGGVSLASVLSGGFEFVSGASLSDTVSSGGVLTVEAGGVASDTLVSSVGALVIGDPGDERPAKGVGATIVRGGLETVYGGGLVVDTRISAGGELTMAGAAEVASAYVADVLGLFVVGVDGLARDIAVRGGGQLIVAGSQTVNQSDSGSGYIPLNASASGVRISRGGSERLLEAALNTGAVVLGGGELLVSGAAAELTAGSGLVPEDTGATISSGGIEQVEAYGLAVGTRVSNGGELIASSGALSGTRVLAGGELWVQAFAAAADDPLAISGVTVSSGGQLRLGSALVGAGETLDYDTRQPLTTTFGGVTIKAGAILTLDAVAVGPGGTLSLGAGQALLATTIAAGGVLDGPGALGGGAAPAATTDQGAVKGVTLDDADLVVGAGGRTVSVAIGAASTEQVAGGAASSDAQVDGQLLVSAGGSTIDATVESGGLAVVQAGATLKGMRVSAGGVVELGAVLVGQTVSSELVGAKPLSSGGVLAATGAVVAYDAPIISKGGMLVDHTGGFAVAAQVLSGGELEGPGKIYGASIVSGGLVTGVEVASGASLDEVTGQVTELRVGGADGSGFVEVQTFASSVTVSDGVVSLGNGLTGAVISTAHVLGGGSIVVAPDAEILGAAVSSGGLLILSGGAGSAITVGAGGLVSGAGFASGSLYGVIADGGRVIDMTVQSGGVLKVSSNGKVSSTEVNSAGSAVIAAGGAASDLAVASGGTLDDDGVATWGVATWGAATSLAGALSGDGVLKVTAGVLTQSGDASAFDGRAVISGGEIKLSTPGGLGAASIGFEASGGASASLLLTVASRPKSGATFAETLVDFDQASESLDLAGVAWVSGATATRAGDRLSLVDGAYSARFSLAGATAAGYAAASDGHGGTLITASSPKATGFAQALASFDPTGGLIGAPMSIGGLVSPEYVLTPPSRTAG